MNQKKNMEGFTELSENVLEKVSGGYLQVSQWRAYASQSILPPLFSQRNTADASDQMIIDRFYSTIQSTMVPGASVVVPIQSLRSDYYTSLRSAVHSATVRQALDDAINLSCGYLAAYA